MDGSADEIRWWRSGTATSSELSTRRDPALGSTAVRMAMTHAFCWPEVRRGGERLVAELSRGLRYAGVEVTVVSSSWSPGEEVVDGVRTIRLPRTEDDQAGAQRAFGRDVGAALSDLDVDLTHSFGVHDGVAALRTAGRRRSRRRRVTVHTDIGVPDRAWWDTQPRRDRRAVHRLVRDVDAYGCMSAHSLGALAEGWGRAGVLLPGGVDLARFVPGTRTPAPTILFAGAITEPRKGVSTLLAALPEVARVEPDVRLALSGPGDAGPMLAEVDAATRDRVDVLGVGELEDLPGLCASAWVDALPSIGETFGLAIIEGLAAGTPAVVGDTHALPELVEPGRTGATCTFDHVPSTAEALLTAIDLARDPATAEACRTSVARFDWRSAVVPRHLAVYSALLEGRPIPQPDLVAPTK